MNFLKNKSITKVIILSISGFFILVCQDSTAKYLGTLMPLNQVIWGRFFFHFVIILILFAILKPKLNLKSNFKINIIRSILIKLEECLALKKNTLLNLAVKERKILKKKGKDFMFRKFDIINTWQGSLLYFFILVLTIFILKRYFILNVNVIEIQNIENQIIDK